MVEALVGEDLRLLAQLEAGLVVVDPSGLVVHWNEQAERLLGLTAEQALGRRLQDCVVLVRGGTSTPKAIRSAAVQPGGWNGQLRARISPGRVLAFQAHVQPVKSDDGSGHGTMVFFWPAYDSAEAELSIRTGDAQMVRDLAGLPTTANDNQVSGIAERALQVVAETWLTDMSVLALDGPSGAGLVIAGPNTSEAARARLARMGSASSRLTGHAVEVTAPIEIDVSSDGAAPAIADPVRALGCRTLRATPIRFGGKSIGTLLLLWTA